MIKKHIHFTGIKGVGMTPLAIIAKEAGFHVTGSDSTDTFITDESLQKAGITEIGDFSTDRVLSVDLLVATGAHGGRDNVEVRYALEKQIPVFMQGEAVGKFIDGTILEKKYKGISVIGSHGKTTTTAMIATLLTKSTYDPSYVVGTSEINPIGLPGHFGKGDYFIAEADEYVNDPVHDKTPKFFYQSPQIIVLTNVDLDHPDIYDNIDVLRNAYLSFIKRLPTNGILITCGDDLEVQKILKDYKGKSIKYGFSDGNDYRVLVTDTGKISVTKDRKEVISFELTVLGNHNALNATAALLVGFAVGIPFTESAKIIPLFKGSKRRSEFIGELTSGALLFDDYAHHPTEIHNTLSAFKKRYPGKRILCIFQPHTYSRTKTLFHEFTKCFSAADSVILTNIYASKREADDPTVSSELLATAMKKTHNRVIFLPTTKDVVEYLDQNSINSDTIVVTMGAGDIYTVQDLLTIKK